MLQDLFLSNRSIFPLVALIDPTAGIRGNSFFLLILPDPDGLSIPRVATRTGID